MLTSMHTTQILASTIFLHAIYFLSSNVCRLNTVALRINFSTWTRQISDLGDFPRPSEHISIDRTTTTRLLTMNVYALRFDTGFTPHKSGSHCVKHQGCGYDEKLIDFLRKLRLALNITFRPQHITALRLEFDYLQKEQIIN